MKDQLIRIKKNNSVESVYLEGIRVDAVDLSACVSLIHDYIIIYRQMSFPNGYVVTPHAEFIYKALFDENFKSIINGSFLSVADGISILWLENFYSRKNTFPRYLLYLDIVFQAFFSLIELPFTRGRDNQYIKDRVTGVSLLNEIFDLCNKEGYRIFLLGGFADTPEKVSKIISIKYPKIVIAGYFAGSARKEDEYGIIKKVSAAHADVLIVAYGSIIEEQWINRNLSMLSTPVTIGVGRSLDYIAGYRKQAPKLFQTFGFEWFYKLITDPSRFKRQFVVFKLVIKAIKVKYVYSK